MSNQIEVINTGKWIEENQSSFQPPVCNKLMHNQQLVVMFVGGPNQREDYHIEEGEELFYQIKGDMCVKIVENGKHRDVHIKEGELFILPARVPHSPQRTANSVGLVIERRRALSEIDGVRWFVPNTTQPLYERWFHCKDLGVELIPIIKAYFASEEYKTKIPSQVYNEQPYELNNVILDKTQHGPFDLVNRINETKENNVLNLTPADLKLQFGLEVLRQSGEFSFDLDTDLDVWLWQLSGSSQVELRTRDNKADSSINKTVSLTQHDSLLIPAGYSQTVSIKISDELSSLFKIVQNPKNVLISN